MSDRSDERQPYPGGSADPDGLVDEYGNPRRPAPAADPYLQQQYHGDGGAPAPYPPPSVYPPPPVAGDGWFRDEPGQAPGYAQGGGYAPGAAGGYDPGAYAPGTYDPGTYDPAAQQQGHQGHQGHQGPQGHQGGYPPQGPDGGQSGGHGGYPAAPHDPYGGAGGYAQGQYGQQPQQHDPYGQGGPGNQGGQGNPAGQGGYGGYDGGQGGAYQQGGHDPYGGGYQQQQVPAYQIDPNQGYQQQYQPHHSPAPAATYNGGWGDYENTGSWLMDQTLTGIHLGLAGEAGMPTYTEAYQRYEQRRAGEAAAEAQAAGLVGLLEPEQQAPLPGPSESPVYRLPGSGAEERMAGIPVGGPRKGGKLGGMLRSSAVMAAGTIISRITGFARNLVIAAALGTSVFANTYNVANTMPTLLYILIGGGALNAVFVPQLVRAMRNDDDGGEAYANRLLTLVMTGLMIVVGVAVIFAPWLIRMLANSLAQHDADFELAITFARYCLPIIFFMGLHVMFGQILNARERYGPMMWTPVLNNIIIITTFSLYIWAAGTAENTGVTSETITADETRLLGIGTLLGMVVQSLAMIPYLKAARFRFRPRFDWRGSGLGKALGLAKWTFLFVLANQAGYLVVTQLANQIDIDARKEGITYGVGFSAYSNALLIWQLPQAVITVSVMTAMLPRMARAAADNDAASVRDDISSGLRLSAVAMIPCAFLFVALGRDIGGLIFAPTGVDSAHWIGYMLMALGLGLIPYSAQYVLLRGFYVYEDTRTPFLNTVWVAAVNAALAGLAYLALPTRWAGVGIAGAYGAAYLVGVFLAGSRLKKRIGDLDGRRVTRTYTRLLVAATIGGVAAFATARFCTGAAGEGMGGSALAVIAGSVVMFAVFFVAANRMRVEEMTAMTGMIKGRLGR